MLKGKTVLLCLSGSIACYKMAYLASSLKKLNVDVHVLMTKNSTNFINPITFETLTGNKCLVDTFDRNFEFNAEHVSLAKKADVVLISPATANIIGKIANGIADDMLTTTVMASTCKKIVSPAMNTNMFHNPIVQDNLKKLESYGYEIIKPQHGYLACGDVGDGKMVEPNALLDYILREIRFDKKDLLNKNVLITAGPTQESIDPVRFITNHSSGKMGYALSKICMQRGANVTLITGPTSIEVPPFVNVIKVTSAKEMFEKVTSSCKDMDIIIKAAAVADYTPVNYVNNKIKKSESEMSLLLKKTDDILKYLGQHRTKKQFICGFSMETENLIENSRKKLVSKNVDMIVCNNLNTEGAGFRTDTNVVTIITDKEEISLGKLSKEDTAIKIVDFIVDKIKDK